VKYLFHSNDNSRYLIAFLFYLFLPDDKPEGSKHAAFYKKAIFFVIKIVLLNEIIFIICL